MSDFTQPLQLAMRSSLPQVKHWFPLFYIWAVQWVASGLIQWIGEWRFPFRVLPVLTSAAVVLSAGYVLIGAGRGRMAETANGSARVAEQAAANTESPAGNPAEPSGRLLTALRLSVWLALPLFVAGGSSLLLLYVRAVNPFFMDLFRALTLSFFYVLLGLLLGRHLVYLGLWLFALCVVTAVWYIGFSPIVLPGIGGFSLAACGWMATRWCREAETESYLERSNAPRAR